MSLLSLFCLLIAFVQTEWGQNWLARQATSRLSRELQSRISIDHVRFSFFNKMNLEGVLLEDRKRDTLLYAGTVQVNITDWFFLQEKADLTYIGLKDAVIKLQRTDSVWNYAFLEDYFGGSGRKEKKESGLDFSLKTVVLDNVSFTSRDGWIGQDMHFKVGGLRLDAKTVSLTRSIIDGGELSLVSPAFHQFEYEGNRPPRARRPAADTTLPWNANNWIIRFDKISIANGTYRNDNDGKLTTTRTWFDERHVLFNQINGTITNARLQVDTFTAQANLTAKERSGFQIQRLRSDLRFHPYGMEFARLYLKTNRSVLTDYFSMSYPSFKAMNDFIKSVRMHGHFSRASVATDDLAYFAPEVKDWNRVFYLSGQVTGTVDALEGKGVNIRSGGTALNGNFSINGLPNINSAFLHVDAGDFLTTYADAVTFLPAIRGVTVPNLRKLGAVRFRGTYTGFFNDFVAYGTLQTPLGALQTDLNMKLPPRGEPVYSGSISTKSFQLGQFINEPQLGVVDFHGNVRGKSFTWDKLDLALNGTIHRIRFGDYTYQNITAKGKLNKKSFNGDFTIQDPNADLKLKGLIIFNGAQPTFDVVASVAKADLKALGLTTEELSLNGKFNLNFKGRTFSDFLGTAGISEATLLHGDKRLAFDSLVVSSSFSNGGRLFRARSNEFDVLVSGQFDLPSLPDAFTLFLNRYYPSYIRAPRRSIPNQNFTFEITTGLVEDYLRLIDRRLAGFNNSRVTGSLNVAANALLLKADIPQFGFQQYRFSDIKLDGAGNFERLSLTGAISNAMVSDSIYFPQTTFTVQAQRDVSEITLTTTANQAINQANLSAQVQTFSNGANILFNPSTFVLNGKTWTIESGGELDFRTGTIPSGQVVLRESNQEIQLTTRPSDIGTWNDLHISLRNLNLGDLVPFLTKTERIEGLLNGDIVVEDPQNRFRVNSTLTTELLRVNGDSIGQIRASIGYDKGTGSLKGSGSNVDPDHQLQFRFDLDLDDSANVHTDLITIQPVNYPVKYLENFIGDLFSDLRGFITGRLDISGEGPDQRFVGKARLRNAGLKVNFTQVFYTIDDTEINLTEDRIDFGTMKLRDKEGNTATVRGSIFHTGFQNMAFNIRASVDGQPVELLNTTYNDNQLFYGRAKGTGSFTLTGREEALNMYVDVRPSTQDSSYITLPPSRSRESGAASFLVERKYGREMTADQFTGTASNINYTVSITANPMLNMEVVLDELTGDIIKGRGSGNLLIQSGTDEPLSIRGRYEIEEGSYLFTFQSFFKKPFVLRQGGNNFIEWTGDPYAARIQFDAEYTAKRVNFAPLINTLALNDQRLERHRGDVHVVAMLRGDLFQPDFSFQLNFPPNSPVYSSPSFSYGLQQIEKNTNEINRQVTYLIVFNSFAPYEVGQQGYLNEFAYNTISGLFFGEVNRQLNQLLSKVLRNNNLTFNFTGSLYNANLVDQSARGFRINQSAFNVSVSAPLIKERVQITFGSTFDVPLQADLQQTIQIFPDVNIEWLINKSGSIRATFFYSQTPDLLVQGALSRSIYNQRTGTKLSYRKEFNFLKDIFKSKGSRAQKDSTEVQRQ